MQSVFKQDFIIKYTLTQAHKMKITCHMYYHNNQFEKFEFELFLCSIEWLHHLLDAKSAAKCAELEQWKKALSKLHTTECVSLEATSTSELDELFSGIQKFSRMLRHTHTQRTLSSSYQIVRFVLKISRNGRLSFAASNAKLIPIASTQCKHLASVKIAVTHKTLSLIV